MEQQVYEALRTAHSPAAPEQLRAQALQYLDQFKRDEACGSWGVDILQQPNAPAEARHFALQCLESLLRYKWSKWPAEVQGQFRTAVMQLVLGAGGTEVFMRERVALLMSGVAERQFPAQWPDMLAEWAGILEERGPVPAIIVLMALRNIAEDCVDADYNSRIPTGRRTDILKQLNLSLPELLQRLYRYMSRIYESRESNPSAGDILKASLQTLKRMVNWVSHELLVGQDSLNFISVFRVLMSEEPTRLEAVECLRDLGSRKFENVAHAKLFMKELELGVAQLLENGSAWSSLVFCETVCHTLSGFLVGNLERLVSEDKAFTTLGTPEHQLLADHLTIMVHLLKLPSLKSSVALLAGWSVIFRSDALRACPDLARMRLSAVLDGYCDKIVKLRFDDDTGSFPDSPVADEEFIDFEEYQTLHSSCKATFVNLLKSSAELYPLCAVDFLKERLPVLVQRFGSATEVTFASEAYRYFEAFITPVDRILSFLPEPQSDKPADVEMVQKISWLLQVLLDWRVADPLLLYTHCLLLEGFRRFYRFLAPQLAHVMERLFGYMEYRDPGVVGRTFSRPSLLMKVLSPEALQVRRRGINSLTEICNSVPDIVVPLLPEMVRRSSDLVLKGEVSASQKPQLIEMLVVVSNAMSVPHERTAFISDLVKSSLEYWEKPETTAAMSSVQGLLKIFGIGSDGSVPASENAWDDTYDSVHELLGALSTFLGVARRLKVPTQEDINSKDPTLASVGKALITDQLSLEDLARINPLLPTWTRVLPNLMLLMRSIHMLWGPEMRSTIVGHPEARHLLSVHDDELLTRLKGGAMRSAALSELTAVRRWPLWLNHVRQAVYQLLDRACTQKVLYYCPDALLALQDAMLNALPCMEHRHVPWFAKMIMESYVINCPTPLFATHLPPLLIPFMNHMLLRCSLTWNNGVSGAGGAAAEGLSDPGTRYIAEGGLLIIGEGITTENYETVLDKIKREVTRSYVEALQTFLALRGSLINSLVESNKAVHHQHSSDKRNRQATGANSAPTSPEGTGGSAAAFAGPGGLMSAPACAVKAHIDKLCRFLVVENEAVAVPLLLSIIGSLCWQDQHSCRRAVTLAHKILEIGAKEQRLYPAFGQELFREVVHALLSEPPWILGMQNELLALACEIYLMLVIGESTSRSPERTPQVLCELPRQVLLQVPGLSTELVSDMEKKMLKSQQCKEKRDAFKDLMQTAAEALGENAVSQMNGNPQAAKEESILRGGKRSSSSSSKMAVASSNLSHRLIMRGHTLREPDGASLSALFGGA